MKTARILAIVYLAMLCATAMAQTGTTWTWTNTGTGGQWNIGNNWTKTGAATTTYPERYSTNQTINITSGTANNGSIDLDFSTTNINISGTGAFSQTTTHHSRFYSGQLNVTDGGAVTMRANNWLWGSGSGNSYAVLIDGGSINYTGGDPGLYIGNDKATTTVTLQETISDGDGGFKASAFTSNGPTNLGVGSGASGTFNMSGGTATFTKNLNIGYSSGTGTFSQTGGTVTAGGIAVGNLASSLSVGNGATFLATRITNAGTVFFETGANITSGSIVNTGTITQSSALTLKDGAWIDSSIGTYIIGGTVRLADGYSVAADTVSKLSSFVGVSTAQSFLDKLDTSNTSTLHFTIEETAAHTGNGGSTLFVANIGTDFPIRMTLMAQTSGAMSDSSNWNRYDSSKTGYITFGTNTLTDMYPSVIVESGVNAFAAGFVVGSANDSTQSLTFSGGTNNFAGQLIVGDGAGKTGEIAINSAVTMTQTLDKNMRQVFIGNNGGKGSMTINTGGTLTTNSGRDFVIASGNNSTGTLTIDGGAFSHSGNFIVGGSSGGTGTMTVNSGTVSVAHMSLGQTMGETKAELNINGGTITSSNGFRVGIDSGSNATVKMTSGTVYVNGTDATNHLYVGGITDATTATGTFNLSGGTVNATNLIIGQASGATGTLNVSGTGILNLKGAVTIGGGKSGVLNLTGGTLTAAGTITVNATGALNLFGGTLTASSITNAGTVEFQNANFALPSGLALNNTGTIAASGCIAIDLSATTFTTTGGTYALKNVTPSAGDTYIMAKVADATMAANFLSMSMPTGWQYKTSTIGTGIYIFAGYGQAPEAGKIWIPGTTGSMATAANWENYSDDAIGYVYAGTNTFSDVVGKTFVQGGANSFTMPVTINDGAELTLAGGVNTFNNKDVKFNIGSGSGQTGTLIISGGTNTFTSQDSQLGVNGGHGIVRQTGGVSSWSGWLNIAETINASETYAGEYYLSGGTMTTNSSFAVGRRGTGYFEISGDAAFNAKGNTFIGLFPQKTGDSLLKIRGGTATFEKAVYLANSGNTDDESGSNKGTSRLNIEGGTTAFKDSVYVSYTGKSNTGGKAEINLTGGKTTFEKRVFVGEGANTEGTVTINLGVGNSVAFQDGLNIGDGDGSKGTLNVQSGTVNWTGNTSIGNSGTGVVNLSGGEIRLTNSGIVSVGAGSSAGNGTLNISGGTFYAPSADFIIGNGGSAGTLTVKGTGTFNQHGKGNLVITGTEANGGAGSIINLQAGGTIDTQWFSMGQNVIGTNAACTLNMTGGTLKISEGSTDGNFRIGHTNNTGAKAIVNLSGGSVIVGGATQLDYSNKGSQLNVIGPKVTFSGNTADLTSTGFLNYSVGKLTNADWAAGNLLSALNFSGSATVVSTVNIDMTVDGIVDLSNVSDQTIFTAGTLNWSPAVVNITDGWELTQVDSRIFVSLVENELPASNVAMGLASIVGNGTETGLTLISGTAGDKFSVGMQIGGDISVETMSLLAQWMADQSGLTVSASENVLLLDGLTLDESGEYLANFGIVGFNAANGTNLTIGAYRNPNVPEPSTWALLLLGVAGVVWLQRRR